MRFITGPKLTAKKKDLTLTRVGVVAMVQILVFRDVFMRDQEQNHLALLILYGHDVQQTPELGPCSRKNETFEKSPD